MSLNESSDFFSAPDDSRLFSVDEQNSANEATEAKVTLYLNKLFEGAENYHIDIESEAGILLNEESAYLKYLVATSGTVTMQLRPHVGDQLFIRFSSVLELLQKNVRKILAYTGRSLPSDDESEVEPLETMSDALLKAAESFNSIYDVFLDSIAVYGDLWEKGALNREARLIMATAPVGGVSVHRLFQLTFKRMQTYFPILRNISQSDNDRAGLILSELARLSTTIQELLSRRQQRANWKVLLQQCSSGQELDPRLSHPLPDGNARRLLAFGTLQKVCHRDIHSRIVALCDDGILYLTSRWKTPDIVASELSQLPLDVEYVVHQFIPMTISRVADMTQYMTDGSTESLSCALQLVHKNIQSPEPLREHTGAPDDVKQLFAVFTLKKSLLFIASSQEEKEFWMSRLEQVQSAAQLPDGIFFAPLWFPDSMAPVCMQCQTPFSALRRKHHCRKCGFVVCGNCSTHNIKICGEFGRVCDGCYTEFLTRKNLASDAAFRERVMRSQAGSHILGLSGSLGAECIVSHVISPYTAGKEFVNGGMEPAALSGPGSPIHACSLDFCLRNSLYPGFNAYCPE